MKTKVLIYCTKAKSNKEKLHRCLDEKWRLQDNNDGWVFSKDSIHFDGKIVAECEVETENIFEQYDYKLNRNTCYTHTEKNGCLQKKSCLTDDELYKYSSGKPIYAQHINNLNIFYKPLELSECKVIRNYKDYSTESSVLKAPQNMMWVWHNGERKALISIQPQWVCKILNGEKTIEVRRKVLKGMCD